MQSKTGYYRGRENLGARRASLLENVSKEARELCPRRNQDWQFVYLEGNTVFYALGHCPSRSCELASLIETRLDMALGEPVQLVRMLEDVVPALSTAQLIQVSDLC
jgi:hypothetical protein